MTWQSHEVLAINHGSQPTALTIGMEYFFSKTVPNRYWFLVFSFAAVAVNRLYVKKEQREHSGLLGQCQCFSENSAYNLGAGRTERALF